VVLLVHGRPGAHRDWRYLAACLQGCRVVRLDMPGFGGSTECGQAPSFAARAEFVMDAITALELASPIVLGHSMGGPVAAMVGRRAPARVRAVGLLASPGLRRHRRAPNALARVTARLAAAPLIARAIRRPLARAYSAAGFPSSLTHAERVAALRQAALYEPTDVAATIGELSLPTLIAFADDDELVEPEIGEELSRSCPAGPRLRFPTGGHNIQKTQCETIAQAVREWLLELPPTP
jgi:pimeloyl-ACP methyl ester carboxylesterase